MEQGSNSSKEQVVCPLCGAWAERGSVYATSVGIMRWMPGEPNWKKGIKADILGGDEPVGNKTGILVPWHAKGIRCHSCRRIVLEW